MNAVDDTRALALPEEQMIHLLEALNALRKGDGSRRLPVNWDGLPGKIADAFNDIVEQNVALAQELHRLSHVVGKEGRLSDRASLFNRRGLWGESVDSVNALIADLVYPTSEVARVIGAVAEGDLSKSMALHVNARPLEGEFLRTAQTINKMVDQLGNFSAEVTRVAREVGTEGKLGGQAAVKGVAGTWKDLTDSVNSMAGNLTGQVRNIAEVTTAVAQGDLSKKIDVDVKGEFLTLRNTINTMVDQLRSFASEVTRVAREVGTEGSLGGQARVEGVSGTWKDLTDSVNSMAGNLTSQVRNIADVTKAVAAGDLSKKITVDVKGEILELKITINTMVDQLRSFAAEVTRVAREVGTEGKLGGQADVQGVAGTWKDLTESVNFMAGNLTSQVRNIAEVTTAVAAGDLSKKITVDVKGEILELKNTINTMVDQLRSFAAEVTRVAREVGTEGKLGGQADVQGVAGTWKDLTDSVNLMASNLTSQVRNIADVTKAVAAGNLSEKITVDVKGEILELKATINTMVDQLSSFASEVTRVARDVGTEGRLGGQAEVRGVSGTWKDLTDNVNSMAGNLTGQVRGIAKVVTAVAEGDLKQKLTVEAKGEIAALADTINGMTDTLATFAEQVTTVAREVGVEGKLGGQAKVPGASGTWKALTENVNELAANLTTQVRAIAEVATAVTQGDLTRSITVDTQGEVASLKDTINEMIRNLRDTTQKNTEQDWLKTNLAKFTRMLQGQRDLMTASHLILSELAPVVGAHQAEFYVLTSQAEGPVLTLTASYASGGQGALGKTVELGEGLVGQCALDKEKILLSHVPASAFRIASGLSESTALDVLVLPVIFEDTVRGVMELASLRRFDPVHQGFLEQLTESIGIVVHTIQANSRTVDLLTQSQSLAEELQSRQQELQQTNQELQDKARLLAHQNHEVERKNQEVEQARQALEEKAEQLALTSKYKSEFLANMSHELRTPLNSLLILSDQLCKNAGGNLNSKQVDYARTIHASGNDLLMLINDILDLSKIESGTVMLEMSDVRLDEIERTVDRGFRHVAESKRVRFHMTRQPSLAPTIFTDPKRLHQIIKNLLSNAFKFTHQGQVTLNIRAVQDGWSPDHPQLREAATVLAFEVEDTGIGIPLDKQQIIFEAFQQADGSTSRKYGGTGLGLAISRELSRLLGGEIRLTSSQGKGSRFTLFLPQVAATHNARLPRAADAHRARLASVRRLAASPVVPAQADERIGNLERDSQYDMLESNPLADDRDGPEDERPTLLLVENDVGFAKVVLDVGREVGFRVITCHSGAMALATVGERAVSAVLLDIGLPDMPGWRVLDRIKSDPSIQHVPVCVVSTDESLDQALRCGAVGFLAKPLPSQDAVEHALVALRRYLQSPPRRILVHAPDQQVTSLLTPFATLCECKVVAAMEETVAALPDADALLLAPGSPLHDLDALREALAAAPQRAWPLHVFLLPDERAAPARQTAIVSDDGQSMVHVVADPAMLFADVVRSLHLDPRSFDATQQALLDHGTSKAGALRGKKVLVVDDDIRNIFALAAILDEAGMSVLSAESGRDAIRIVDDDDSIDVVLMDIMMPEMDGIETIGAIRKVAARQNLPIVAVTAKAMKGDREKCIEAGAWDYVSKPVDPTTLLAVLRGWLCR